MTPLEKMGAIRIYPVLAIVIAAVFLSSCQKEDLTDPVLNTTPSDPNSVLASSNTSPSVDAGPIGRMIYSSSSNTATLHGNATSNNGPVTVKWSQKMGNSTATIAQPTQETTSVGNLKPGIYTFLLTATDKSGITRTDTTSITVLERITWTIEGVTREALVHPATGGSGKAPIIFAFHGHTGTDIGFAERGFELDWPEAIVVYPQGLRTKNHSDRDGKYAGWQSSVGEVNSFTGTKDQDLKFFDAMLSTLSRSYNANTSLVFAHGWSNGGEFIYNVLWDARADQLAGISPSGATLSTTNGKKTMPIIYVAGTQDPSVHFSYQQQSVQSDRSIDKCSSNGTTWATGGNGILGTRYASSVNAPVVLLQYNGGHAYPFSIPPYIVKFFKELAGVPTN